MRYASHLAIAAFTLSALHHPPDASEDAVPARGKESRASLLIVF